MTHVCVVCHCHGESNEGCCGCSPITPALSILFRTWYLPNISSLQNIFLRYQSNLKIIMVAIHKHNQRVIAY